MVYILRKSTWHETAFSPLKIFNQTTIFPYSSQTKPGQSPGAYITFFASELNKHGYVDIKIITQVQPKTRQTMVFVLCAHPVFRAGLRGGYMEVINMDPAVNKYLRSMQDSSSPPVLPQLALEIMVNPPTPGQPSYKMYSQVGGTLHLIKKDYWQTQSLTE